MPVGFAAGQICHAAGENLPAEPGTHAIILGVDDEQALLAVAKRLKMRDIDFYLIHESDSPYLGAATAIGLPPGPAQPALGKLRLYKEEGTKS